MENRAREHRDKNRKVQTGKGIPRRRCTVFNIFGKRETAPPMEEAPSDKRTPRKRRTFVDFKYLSNIKPEKRRLGGRRRADCMDIS